MGGKFLRPLNGQVHGFAPLGQYDCRSDLERVQAALRRVAERLPSLLTAVNCRVRCLRSCLRSGNSRRAGLRYQDSVGLRPGNDSLPRSALDLTDGIVGPGVGRIRAQHGLEGPDENAVAGVDRLSCRVGQDDDLARDLVDLARYVGLYRVLTAGTTAPYRKV